MKLISRVIAVFLIALAVVFSLSNRELVTLELWPFPPLPEAFPLFVVVLGAFVIGFVAGGLVVWISAHDQRVRARRDAKKAAAYDKAETENAPETSMDIPLASTRTLPVQQTTS